MNIIVGLIPLFLVVLAFTWALWLIFRKGDMVTQPVKMIGYFVGALLALLIAGFLMIWIFPAWAYQLLGTARTSPSVQGVQQEVKDIFQQELGPVTTATPVRPVATVAVSTTPVTGTVGGQSLGPGRFEHTVQKGETLYSIAQKYGVTVATLQSLNKITDPNKIKQGDKLIIKP